MKADDAEIVRHVLIPELRREIAKLRVDLGHALRRIAELEAKVAKEGEK